ncbi:MAG: hypothetical protein Q9225_002978 [Loekoesia sp. 1 TL-2023]
MDLDQEASPVTVRGDSPPRSREPQPDIIDLDSFDDLSGLSQDDFLTDEEFDAYFCQNTQTESHHTTILGHEFPTTYHKTIESYSVNGSTYRTGKTVEFEDGDFFRISDVLEERPSKRVMLRGNRFRRTSKFRGLFDQHLNEVIMLVERMDTEPLEEGQLEVETVPLSNAVKVRDLILTNEAYPLYSFRQDGRNIGLSRASARESCRLVCRWKVVITYRMKMMRKACVEMSITRLRTEESDRRYRARDMDLRTEWRGVTIKGGSCPAWLPGEKQFDSNERKKNQEINILGFHRQTVVRPQNDITDLTTDTLRQPSERRYTFGDAFCGAGGASRAAKSVGFRVEWGVDFDLAPIKSYRQNFFGARCEATPVHVFVTYIGENYVVDILHLSPPCKTFSPLHTRPGQDDEMNSASFFAVEELLKKAKPRIVTMENTFGLVERWREWLNTMVRFFTSLGFSVRWKVLNLAEYGLPQARRRLIVFASCPGETLPGYPRPTYGPGRLPFTTINDAIGMIPNGFPNHNTADAPKRNATAYNGDLPLRNCITTAGSIDIHPSGKRGFTDRELACLQGFPLEHKFEGNKIKMQIGNAVPPLVANVFFAHIRRCLEEIDGQSR